MAQRHDKAEDEFSHLTSREMCTLALLYDERNQRGENPEGASSWSALARSLKVSRSSLYEWRRLDGAPDSPDVEAWVEFLAESDRGTHAGGLFSSELNELRRLLILEKVEGLRIKNEVAMANYLPASIVREEWKSKAALAEAVLRRVFEDELPPRFLGLDAVAIQRLQQAAIDGVCRELSGQG